MEYVFYGMMVLSVIAFILLCFYFSLSRYSTTPEEDERAINAGLVQMLLLTILFCVAAIAANLYGSG